MTIFASKKWLPSEEDLFTGVKNVSGSPDNDLFYIGFYPRHAIPLEVC